MAPITTTNDFQQSYENMNTSFVSSMKTSYQSAPAYNQQQTTQEMEPSQSTTSIKTLVKNRSNSPVTILNPKSPNSLKEASSSNRNSRKSIPSNRSNMNNSNDQSESIATYVSSRQSSKKRTSGGSETYVTPPFTPSQSRNISTSRLSSQMSANNEQYMQGSRNKGSHINQRSSNSFPSSSSMKHTVQFQNSSIYNTHTPTDNPNSTFHTASFPTGTSGRTSFQTTTTYDPTSITPFGQTNRQDQSFQMQSSLPISSSNTTSHNNMMVPSSRNTQFGTSVDMSPSSMYQQNSNNFMPNNPNNPNSKDFSYMLFNIKVFRTPKEQS